MIGPERTRQRFHEVPAAGGGDAGRRAAAIKTRGRNWSMDNTSRTVLLIGTAMVAGGMMEGAAFGQAAAPTIVPLYGGPAFPTCVAKVPTDCRLPNGKPDLTGLYAAGGPSTGGGGGAVGVRRHRAVVRRPRQRFRGLRGRRRACSARRATTARTRRCTSRRSGKPSSRPNTRATSRIRRSGASRTACRATAPRRRSSRSSASRS